MVSIQVTRRYNRAESTILGLVSLGEGLEVAGSVGSCVSALFRSQVRSGKIWKSQGRSVRAFRRCSGRRFAWGGLVGVWRIASNVWLCSDVVGIVWYELGSL